MMRCACGGITVVKDSRPSSYHALPTIRRRRLCEACGKRITTYELTTDQLDHMMPPVMPAATRVVLQKFLDQHTDT